MNPAPKVILGQEHLRNIVVKFWLLNNMLSIEDKFEVVPCSGIGHKFILITEMSFLHSLPPSIKTVGGRVLSFWFKHKEFLQTNGSLWQTLFPRALEKKKMKLIDQVEKNVNFGENILITTIKTDGLELNLLYIDRKTVKTPELQKSDKSPVELAKMAPSRKMMKSDEISEAERKIFKTVVGGDPGEIYYLGLCSTSVNDYVLNESRQMSFKDSAKVTNLKLKTTAASEPSRRYRNFLEHEKAFAASDASDQERRWRVTKTKVNIFDLEQDMGRKLIPAVNRVPDPEIAIVEINPRPRRLIRTSIGNWHRETLDDQQRLAEILPDPSTPIDIPPEDFQSTRHIEEPFIDWWRRYKVLTILIDN